MSAISPTEALWPRNTRELPSTVFQMRMVLSSPDEMSCEPLGRNNTCNTASVCPCIIWLRPELSSHILTVISPLPDASREPSVENVRQFTESLCPESNLLE